MSLPRKALLLGNYLSSKGYSRGFIEELADRLEEIGWECRRASSLTFKPARLLDMVHSALLYMRQVSVVHIPLYSGYAFVWAAIGAELATLARTPLVMSLHGGNLPAFSKKWPRAVRHILGRATIVVAPSEYLRSALRPYRKDIKLMPNPVELTHYEFRERKPLNPRLIWLRAFHRIYNPMLAPRVLALLRHQYPDAHLLMIGSDKGDGTLEDTKRIAAELGVASQIEFHGVIPKKEVPVWLDKGDIFISTTNIDNTPVSVLEAMACGLPVVSTNVGGVPYLLEDGSDALLVPPEDPAAMVAAVVRLITDPALAHNIVIAGRRKVEGFDWAAMVVRWDGLLLEAASRSTRDHP
jgi:glycosyltransferase involved in cell wall biosynthesis